jgi:hypothetical protein
MIDIFPTVLIGTGTFLGGFLIGGRLGLVNAAGWKELFKKADAGWDSSIASCFKALARITDLEAKLASATAYGALQLELRQKGERQLEQADELICLADGALVGANARMDADTARIAALEKALAAAGDERDRAKLYEFEAKAELTKSEELLTSYRDGWEDEANTTRVAIAALTARLSQIAAMETPSGSWASKKMAAVARGAAL